MNSLTKGFLEFVGITWSLLHYYLQLSVRKVVFPGSEFYVGVLRVGETQGNG